MQHIYETISLSTAGYGLSIGLILVHLWMLMKPSEAQDFLKKLPRNKTFGAVLMGTTTLWFWLLTMKQGSNPLAMDLNDFNGIKPILLFLVPIAGFLVITQMEEFLAVRALGFFLMMAASPLLEAAKFETNTLKILIPIYAYVMLTAGMFMVGMPYLLRDLINWMTAKKQRYMLMAGAGLSYGVLVLVATVLYYGK